MVEEVVEVVLVPRVSQLELDRELRSKPKERLKLEGE